jgi:hypothetical protein
MYEDDIEEEIIEHPETLQDKKFKSIPSKKIFYN